MSRYRLRPSVAQEAMLLGHCAQARYVWNLCDVRKLNRNTGEVRIPKAGWVRFR